MKRILKSTLYTGIVFMFLGSKQISAATRYVTVADSSARDAFIGAINQQIGVLNAAIKRLEDTTTEKEKENTENKLALAELYAEREMILVDREELLKDYLTLKSQIQATKSSIAGLESMQKLMLRVLEQPLAEELTLFLDEYTQSSLEQKTILKTKLRELKKKTLDPEDLKTITELERALEYYGLYLNDTNELTSQKNKEELDVVESAFSKLRTYFEAGDIALKAELKQCESVLEKQRQELARFEQKISELKSSSGGDLEKLEKFNADIAARNNTIQANKSYSSILVLEKNKITAEIAALEAKKSEAPPVGSRVVKEYYETVNERDGGALSGRNR